MAELRILLGDDHTVLRHGLRKILEERRDWHVVSEAGTSEIDKAGRVLIPGRLRKLIPVDEDQEVILVGLYHRMEVWNPSQWRRYLAKTEDRYEENMAKIHNLL